MNRRRARTKWPWERDPNDHEANYRHPVPLSERLRLGLKAAIAVGAFLAVRQIAVSGDRSLIGPKILIVAGVAVAMAGAIDLVWTLRGKLEHIFVETRPAQIVLHAGVSIAGAVATMAGIVQLL